MAEKKENKLTTTKTRTKDYIGKGKINPISKENIKDTSTVESTVINEVNTEEEVKAIKGKKITYRPRMKIDGVDDPYKETKAKIVELVAADTYTKEEICNMAGISNYILDKWMKEDIEFFKALKNAEIIARQNFNVIAKNSLRRLIEGFEATDVTVAEKFNKQGEIVTVTSKVTKVYKPDTAAVIFTLTNVDPDNWKNRRDVSGEITTNQVIDFNDLEDYMKDLSDEDLEDLKRIALNIQKLKE